MAKGGHRGTDNVNQRGNTKDRLARRIWLCLTFDLDLGPHYCRCAFGCGAILDVDTVTADRYPIPGCEGGTYRRDNIRPACAPCNTKHGAALGVIKRAERRLLKLLQDKDVGEDVA